MNLNILLDASLIEVNEWSNFGTLIELKQINILFFTGDVNFDIPLIKNKVCCLNLSTLKKVSALFQ